MRNEVLKSVVHYMKIGLVGDIIITYDRINKITIGSHSPLLASPNNY
jgi:hypothetical protein